ncbi:SAC3 domain-containing protein 1 [Mytilus galloprovincialis]|uniref:SAC3 domain-containing protein 1 n=1 Tax=Mytilus galloprovincialis TaxID=29158 RepID=A0A8B6EVV3_MYTGA|nr:SAC3 domain-containing protein 1 [Mytilus galloprovincialis]
MSPYNPPNDILALVLYRHVLQTAFTLIEDIHFLEKTLQNGRLQTDTDKMVKEYSRPAAGKRDPGPNDLRPPEVLVRTVDYLLGSITAKKDVAWKDIYDFVFDRLRCIRQDMVIQNIGGSSAINILEKIARFHIYAGYRLCTEPIARFDPKINNQHTQECLKRLLYVYSVEPGNHDNRQEFESVYLLYNLGQTDALMHFYDLSKDLRTSSLISLCYRTSIEYMIGNNVRCLRLLDHHLCKQYPILLCALHRHLSHIQRQSLQTMNTAFSSKFQISCGEPLKVVYVYKY